MLATRKLPQFRVALNSRCGRACFYCRPSGESLPLTAGESIAPDSLLKIATVVRRYGIGSIKLTGGDPALYGQLEEVVYRLRAEAGFEEIELISRNPLIGARAEKLAQTGVTQFNISLDTLKADVHRQICGVDDLPKLLSALSACVRTKIPCKVNTVVLAGVNDGELDELVEFCGEVGVVTLKFLDLISDLHQGGETFSHRAVRKEKRPVQDMYMSLEGIRSRLENAAVRTEIVRQGDLGHPMPTLTMPSGLRVIFKDSSYGAWYGTVCNGCRLFPCHDALMALRLTADLRLQFCLLNETTALPLKELVNGRQSALEAAVAEALAVYTNAHFVQAASSPRPIVRQ